MTINLSTLPTGQIVARLAEPSTYAGLAGIALALGVSQPLYSAISAAAAGIFGIVAIVLKETGNAAA